MARTKHHVFGVFIGCLFATIFYQMFAINSTPKTTKYRPVANNWTTNKPFITNINTRASRPTTKAPLPIEDAAKCKPLLITPEVAESLQAERLHTLNDACTRFLKKNTSNYKKMFVNPANYISRKYKLVSCSIRKCGFSSWLSAMFVMENIFTVAQYKKRKIHGDRIINLAASKLTLRSIKNLRLRRKLWLESIKVITVRNPFSRLVSAYYDKMLTTSPGYTYVYRAKSKTINKNFRHLRHNATERNQTDDGNATFEDFVNFLVQSKSKMESHWDLFFNHCTPCYTQYDYIIKFETLNNDIDYLKEKIKISSYHGQAFFPKKKYKTNWDLVEKTFKTIPKELGLKLYEKYQIDFEMFGYKKPDWLN